MFINTSELSWSELYEVQEVTRSEIPSLFSFLVEVEKIHLYQTLTSDSVVQH